MKAVPQYQQVIAMRNLAFPRDTMSLNILAMHEAANIAGGRACGRSGVVLCKCITMIVVKYGRCN
jgi:hypothetical protein